MLDFEKLAQMTFLVFVLDQVIVFENGIILDKYNFSEFISFQFDA